MTESILCTQCGTQINPNTRFCPECGFPVQAEFYQTSHPASPIPPTQRMEDTPGFAAYPPTESRLPGFDSPEPPRGRSRRTIYLIGGGIGLAACCVLGAIALFFTLLGNNSGLSLALSGTATPTSTPVTPIATAWNTPVVVKTTPTSGFTGKQTKSEHEFFDDFSSRALQWAESGDARSSLAYENGAYAISVMVGDYRQLSRPPLKALSHLEFNATVANNPENGTFGVACYYQDLGNYHFVEFDLSNQSYRFGQVEDSDFKALTDWKSISNASQPIRYGIDCLPGLMALYLNGQLIEELAVNQPMDRSEMWLFVMSWNDAASGLKVIFDDVSGYKAMQ